MTVTTGNSPDVIPRPMLGGCGGCTYTYDPEGGCYTRQGAGNCTGDCRCSPIICGLGSQIIQQLRPETVTSDIAVGLSCFTAASDDEWIAKALLELAAERTSPAAIWKRVSIAMGILAVLLAVGLVIALVSR
jgi:F0F1-type ATP synthase membrane subunit c/vacuolar-type H+-ATPase subunit K